MAVARAVRDSKSCHQYGTIIKRAVNILGSVEKSCPKTESGLKNLLKPVCDVITFIDPLEALDILQKVSGDVPMIKTKTKTKVNVSIANVANTIWKNAASTADLQNRMPLLVPVNSDKYKQSINNVKVWLKAEGGMKNRTREWLKNLTRKCTNHVEQPEDELKKVLENIVSIGYASKTGEAIENLAYSLPSEFMMSVLKAMWANYLTRCKTDPIKASKKKNIMESIIRDTTMDLSKLEKKLRKNQYRRRMQKFRHSAHQSKGRGKGRNIYKKRGWHSRSRSFSPKRKSGSDYRSRNRIRDLKPEHQISPGVLHDSEISSASDQNSSSRSRWKSRSEERLQRRSRTRSRSRSLSRERFRRSRTWSRSSSQSCERLQFRRRSRTESRSRSLSPEQLRRSGSRSRSLRRKKIRSRKRRRSGSHSRDQSLERFYKRPRRYSKSHRRMLKKKRRNWGSSCSSSSESSVDSSDSSVNGFRKRYAQDSDSYNSDDYTSDRRMTGKEKHEQELVNLIKTTRVLKTLDPYIIKNVAIENITEIPKELKLEAIPTLLQLHSMQNSKPKTVKAFNNALKGACRFTYVTCLHEAFSSSHKKMGWRKKYKKSCYIDSPIYTGSVIVKQEVRMTPIHIFEPLIRVSQTNCKPKVKKQKQAMKVVKTQRLELKKIAGKEFYESFWKQLQLKSRQQNATIMKAPPEERRVLLSNVQQWLDGVTLSQTNKQPKETTHVISKPELLNQLMKQCMLKTKISPDLVIDLLEQSKLVDRFQEGTIRVNYFKEDDPVIDDICIELHENYENLDDSEKLKIFDLHKLYKEMMRQYRRCHLGLDYEFLDQSGLEDDEFYHHDLYNEMMRQYRRWVNQSEKITETFQI